MASELFEHLALLSALRESARSGDWKNVGELVAVLAGRDPPSDIESLALYLQNLHEILVVAKASRADAAASLIRLDAAAGFRSLPADGIRQSRSGDRILAG